MWRNIERGLNSNTTGSKSSCEGSGPPQKSRTGGQGNPAPESPAPSALAARRVQAGGRRALLHPPGGVPAPPRLPSVEGPIHPAPCVGGDTVAGGHQKSRILQPSICTCPPAEGS